MAIYRLGRALAFPPADDAPASGPLAVGGDLRPERLLLAYSQGIFPWYSEDVPILWHSPDPRFVLTPDALHVARSLLKVVRRGTYEIRYDTAFTEVLRACAAAPRPGQDGTWITDEMQDAYIELHRLGFAHSAEAWSDGRLAGGLYGVSLGGVFFGESMFAHAPDASKVAFVQLVERLRAWAFDLVDCQVFTAHLRRFGASEWPRARFLELLRVSVQRPTRSASWSSP